MHSSRLAIVLLAALTQGLGAQAGPPRETPFTAPDGSAFVLVPRKTHGVVFWASFTRMGRVHEMPGQEGLAEACAIASLSGTRSTGATAPAKEAAALARLDELGRQLARARRSGDTKTAERLVAETAGAEAELVGSGDPLRFRSLLLELPATAPRIEVTSDGTLLTSSLRAERLAAFAALMRARRSDTVLRDFHAVMRRLRARRTATSASLRAACLLAFEVHPCRRSQIPASSNRRFISHAEAKRFYALYQRPERTVTAVVGDFDVEATRAMLTRVFRADPNASTVAPPITPEEPAQEGQLSRDIRSDKQASLVIGWRVPEDTRTAELDLLARVVAGGANAALGARLVRNTNLATSSHVIPRFPGAGDPALFVIEFLSDDADRLPELETTALRFFEKLRKNGPPAADLALAVLAAQGDTLRRSENPEALAAWVARSWLSRPVTPRHSPITPDLMRTLTARLFHPSRLTIVRARPRDTR